MSMAPMWLAGIVSLLLQSPALAYELVLDVDSHYNNSSRVASASRVVDLAVIDPDHPELRLKASGRFRYNYTPMVPFQDKDYGILRASHGQTFAITLLDAQGNQIGTGSTSVSVAPRRVFNVATLQSLTGPISGVLTSLFAGYLSGSQLSANASAAANAGYGLALSTSLIGISASSWQIWNTITSTYQFDEQYLFEARPNKDEASGVKFTRRLSSN